MTTDQSIQLAARKSNVRERELMNRALELRVHSRKADEARTELNDAMQKAWENGTPIERIAELADVSCQTVYDHVFIGQEKEDRKA